MPYFLAVLEERLTSSATRLMGTRRGAAAQSRRAAVVPCAIPDDVEPVWGAVLRELQGTLSAHTFNQQLAPTWARSTDDGALEVHATSAFHARWLDRSLRKRVEEALELAGHGDTQVYFVAPDDSDACALQP
jgi:hypothetical protein